MDKMFSTARPLGYFNYDKPQGALWAENCPNFLAGKTEVFSGKKIIDTIIFSMGEVCDHYV
jgi:hypothetical protein